MRGAVLEPARLLRLRLSFVGRGLRYSDSNSPLFVSKKNMFPVLNTVGGPGIPPVFVVTVGQRSPNDSSMKLAILPSQLNVAECQKSTFGWSWTQRGFAVSGRPVFLSMFQTWACSPQAAPTIPLSGNELRS